jgi:hypothetical protein
MTVGNATASDVSKNVDWVIAEAIRQIDQQMTTSGEIDTRASTLLGVLGGVAGVVGVFGQLNFDTPLRILTTVAAAGFGVLASVSLAACLWPRDGASYGTELGAKPTYGGALDLADHLSTLEFRRNMAKSLADARATNATYLDRRQTPLEIGIALFAVSVLCVLLMMATGVFIAVPAVSK